MTLALEMVIGHVMVARQYVVTGMVQVTKGSVQSSKRVGRIADIEIVVVNFEVFVDGIRKVCNTWISYKWAT